MDILEKIKEIPMINDHTHIFGCDVPEYEKAGAYAADLTGEKLITSLSWMNGNETATTGVLNEPEAINRVLNNLFEGRRTTFPVRAAVRMFKQYFSFKDDEINTENVKTLVDELKRQLPTETDKFFDYISKLSNTEIYFCNHGSIDNVDQRTTQGRFKWVPYINPDLEYFNSYARKAGFDNPVTLAEMREVIFSYLKRAKESGAVAVKGGAFAYDLDRPFAPDLGNLKKIEASKMKLDKGIGDKNDKIIFEDVFALLSAEAAGLLELPLQIHVGLIWTAFGPTRIPEIKELAPVFYMYPDTTFVIFHAGYPRIDDLAHITASMTNVRAEFNWAPMWAGLEFPSLIGKWIDMIPNDRILYGTDANGITSVIHDMVSREGVAEALEVRIRKGYLTEKLALQIAANIFRNNAIDTYGLKLPKYQV